MNHGCSVENYTTHTILLKLSMPGKYQFMMDGMFSIQMILDTHYHRIYNIDSITFAYCLFKVIEDV